mmetsp:Transcript_9174/g.24353  ORF Transcript_9174/g.24353 Transcript_9174/m.24353 type:complete len:235 (+) Transcript_9174:35-739(+)
MSPVLAKRARFSTRLAAYISSTIMSFLKILSLNRYPLVSAASMKSLKASMMSAWPRASAAPSKSSSSTFQRTSAATSSTSEPSRFTRTTCTRLDMRPQLVICFDRGRYSDMSRMAPSVITIASGLSSFRKEAESASITCECRRILRLGVPASATAWISGWSGCGSTLSSSSPKRDQHASVCATSMRMRSKRARRSSKMRSASAWSPPEGASSSGGKEYCSTLTRTLMKAGRWWP